MAKPKRGRPREYDGSQPGAPRLTVRFPPDLLAWVKERGGGAFLRKLAEAERDMEDGTNQVCGHCGEVIEPSQDRVHVVRRQKDDLHFHQECALPLLSD